MKIIKYRPFGYIAIAGAVLIVFTVASCSEDFLDKKPVSSPSEKGYYEDENQIEGSVVAAYDQFIDLADNLALFQDYRSDNFYYWQYEGHAFANNSWETWGTGLWSGLYQLVFRANKTINALEEVEIDNESKYEAEARFLRGYAYFWLVRGYGKLPLVTEELGRQEAMDKPRSPVADVYTQIENDLQFAVDNLPPESPKGKANKYVAEAILARAYIMQSGYPVNADKYGDAKPLLEDIIQNGGYELEENFEDIFTLEGENGPEIIWSAVMDGNPKGNQHDDDTELLHPNAGGRSLILGEYQVGGNNNSKSDIWLSFEEGDIRRDASIDTIGINNTGQTWKRLDIAKYEYGHVPAVGWTSDYILCRYANILLLYAETLHKTGGGEGVTGEDKWELLNRIRDRAELEDVSSSDGDFMEILLKERRHEFVYEGVRWSDLVRTNTFVEELKKVRHDNAQDFWKYLPIPKVEMDKMAGKWENNDGYDW